MSTTKYSRRIWLTGLLVPLLACDGNLDTDETSPGHTVGDQVSTPSSSAPSPGIPSPPTVDEPASMPLVVSTDRPGPPSLTDAAGIKRQELIRFLWGNDGFPSTKLPSSVHKDVASPVDGLSNLERVDNLHIQMDAGVESLAHHFIPAVGKKNRLVILHHGHASTFNDDPSLEDVGAGMQRTIRALLIEGYSVLAVYMPGYLPGQPPAWHGGVVETTTTGSGIKFFLEPVAVFLNYLETQSGTDAFPSYSDFSMVGLSGGGWTTTVYAAIDPRIKLSIHIAGSIPLPLRSGASLGDEEQTYPPLYQIAGYIDLYVLGSLGTGRRQVQVLNRHDDGCFGEDPSQYDPSQTGMSYDDALRGFELDVRKKLKDLQGGAYRLEIDEAATGHMISWNAIGTIILPELDGRDQVAVTSTGDTFARGPEGTLVHTGPNGHEDTGISMVGVPAILRRGSGSFDVFFRDPKNRLMHAHSDGVKWTAESLATVIITDPVTVESNAVAFDVVAVTSDYLLHHWHGDNGNISSQAIAGAPKALGQPIVTASPENQLDVAMQDWNRSPIHLHSNGSGVWLMDGPSGTEPSPPEAASAP